MFVLEAHSNKVGSGICMKLTIWFYERDTFICVMKMCASLQSAKKLILRICADSPCKYIRMCAESINDNPLDVC